MMCAGSWTEFPAPKVIRSQRLSSKELSAKRRLLFNGLAIACIITIALFVVVWMRVKVIQMGYRIVDLKKEFVELTQEVNRLRLEVARLKSPQRLERIARTRLGMHYPAKGEVVFVNVSEDELLR